jgi:prepilin-type processing-associated H-X9-DG protein
MQSHEAVKVAVENKGPKEIAAALNVSLSLVYKWCEGKTANPLDRVEELVKATGSTEPLSWLCTRANGTFLPRPPATPADDARLVDDTRRMLKEFSDVLSAMTAAFLDGHVSQEEATLIRREWEELMPIAEGLVRACEARAEVDARRR